MTLIRTPLRLSGALFTATLVFAGCPAPHAPPPKPPASAVEHLGPAAGASRRFPITPPPASFEQTGGDSAANTLARMIDGPERTWVCRTIDLGLAVQDGRLSMSDFGALAAQEGAGLAPQGRQRQAQAAVQRLLDGDPEALKDLACI